MLIRVGGKEYPLTLQRITLGEQRQLKLILGRPLTQVDMDPEDPDVKVAIIWLAMHRADPSVTVEQVEALADADIDAVPEDSDLPAETEAESDPPAQTSASGSGSESPRIEPEHTTLAGVESERETIPSSSGSPSLV